VWARLRPTQKTFLSYFVRNPKCQRYYFLTGTDPFHSSDDFNNLGLAEIASGLGGCHADLSL
jgi:hypothetical protein